MLNIAAEPIKTPFLLAMGLFSGHFAQNFHQLSTSSAVADKVTICCDLRLKRIFHVREVSVYRFALWSCLTALEGAHYMVSTDQTFAV